MKKSYVPEIPVHIGNLYIGDRTFYGHAWANRYKFRLWFQVYFESIHHWFNDN